MAISKTAAEILAAAQTCAAVAASSVSQNIRESNLSILRGPFEVIREIYVREVADIKDITVVDEAEADVEEMFEEHGIVDGDAFRVAGTGDTADNALETAKGEAVVTGDVFNRVGDTVEFVGAEEDVPADVADLTDVLAD